MEGGTGPGVGPRVQAGTRANGGGVAVGRAKGGDGMRAGTVVGGEGGGGE